MKWYSFRKRRLPLISPVIYFFKQYDTATVGTDFLIAIVLEDGQHIEYIFNKDYEKAGEYFLKLFLQDKNFLKKRFKQSREISRDFLDFCRNKISNLSGCTQEELLEILDKYYAFYQEFSNSNITPWVFLTDKLSYYILDQLSNFVKEDINKVFLTLSTPNEPTYLKKEELAVLSLAIKIKGKGDKDFKGTADFKKLVESYFWIPFDYIGPEIWDEKYYIKRINELLLFDIVVLRRQEHEVKQYQIDLEIRQKDLIRKLSIPQDLADLFEGLKDLATLQDEKKAITTESHYYLQKLYKELAKRTKMDYNHFYFLLVEEIKDALLKSKDFKELAEARKKFSVSEIKDGKIKILAGNEAKKYAREKGILLPSQEAEEEVNEIKGTTGSQGYAVGEVKIVYQPEDMSKFEKGRILVTPMTTPIYVPIMHKAKAIVTDEGGITCHAAIVSRELGIPCVIGTSMATKVLKDGDIVEVDANQGIIKILKRK